VHVLRNIPEGEFCAVRHFPKKFQKSTSNVASRRRGTIEPRRSSNAHDFPKTPIKGTPDLQFEPVFPRFSQRGRFNISDLWNKKSSWPPKP
jgi:hypothetical protein